MIIWEVYAVVNFDDQRCTCTDFLSGRLKNVYQRINRTCSRKILLSLTEWRISRQIQQQRPVLLLVEWRHWSAGIRVQPHSSHGGVVAVATELTWLRYNDRFDRRRPVSDGMRSRLNARMVTLRDQKEQVQLARCRVSVVTNLSIQISHCLVYLILILHISFHTALTIGL